MYKDRHIKVERICEQCGSSFMAQQSRIKLGQGRFCSLGCANLWQKENSLQPRGFENGIKYFSQSERRWIVRWYDEDGNPHTTSYAKWWWIMNVGHVPDGYVISYVDSNPENINPTNFECVKRSFVSSESGKLGKGRIVSEESKKLMSQARLGKKLSPEHRANIGKSVKMRWERGDYINTIFTDISGDKNPGWRGGAGQEYPPEFNKSLKRFIWERDNSVCQICGTHVSRRGTIGHIHHIDGYKENNDLDNLILLCQNCHGKIHKSKDTSSPIIMSFRSRLYWNQ